MIVRAWQGDRGFDMTSFERFREFLRMLAVLAPFAGPVCADFPTPLQERCILSLEAAGARVAQAGAQVLVRCVREALRGDAGSGLDACFAAAGPNLARARAQTLDAAAACAQAPDYGPTDPQAIGQAFADAFDPRRLFGADPAATLRAAGQTPAAARCLTALTEEFSAAARAEIADYRPCLKRRFARKEVFAANDFEACIGTEESAATRRAKRHALTQIAAQCRDAATRPRLPGACAEAASAEELGACLAAQAHCGACAALNGAHAGAAKSCLRYENGAARFLCGARAESKRSVARQWDEEILEAIRADTPRPPVHARNLFHLSVAMYDAWGAYDGHAQTYLTAERLVSADPARDRNVAVSFAAYRVLTERYSETLALNADRSQARFRARMHDLGLDPDYLSTVGDAPAAVGNRIAQAVIDYGLRDGSNEAENYDDPGYSPVNPPLIVKEPDIALTDPSDPSRRLDPNRWQPLSLDKIVTQNGIPLPAKVQTFIGSQWGAVAPFALTENAQDDLYSDPGPPPRLGGAGDAAYREQAVQLIRLSSYLTADDPTVLDISPASLGNNSPGANDGAGYPANPVTGAPYTPQPALRGDFGRALAEYWADGPTSETPPGHWNLFANAVADAPGFERRIGGEGPVLDALEWDVKTYFALNGALHDAAVACWGAKRKYDGARPITMVRYMAKMGQSSDPALPSYHPDGLPLIPGLIELVTAESAAPGGRHAELTTPEAGGRIGDIAVLAWPGSPDDPKTQVAGVRWTLGKAWVPYQRKTFVTPAFPGYFSGHSTFSRAAAEALAALVGSPYFPGGLYEFVAPQDRYLIHERGPSREVRLQWASFFDAADQAGQSRLWGGIHAEADDFAGRLAGRRIGLDAFAKAAAYFRGNAR